MRYSRTITREEHEALGPYDYYRRHYTEEEWKKITSLDRSKSAQIVELRDSYIEVIECNRAKIYYFESIDYEWLQENMARMVQIHVYSEKYSHVPKLPKITSVFNFTSDKIYIPSLKNLDRVGPNVSFLPFSYYSGTESAECIRYNYKTEKLLAIVSKKFERFGDYRPDFIKSLVYFLTY